VEVRRRIDDPVDPAIIEALSQAFSDFRCAYTDDGLTMEEFDSFPPTVGTLRFFIKGYYDLLFLVTDFLLPNPELAPTAV
jgi:transaldolase